MKTLGRLVLALCLLSPAVAAADHPGDGQGKHGKKHKKVKKILRKFDRMVAKLDRDGDGRLGPDEVDDRARRFQRFDADGDGWVTREEIIVAIKDRMKARKAKRAAKRAAQP